MKPSFSERTRDLILACLFREDEPKDNPVLVHGVVGRFGFNRTRLTAQRDAIRQLADEIVTNDFRIVGGGGMSFLNLCIDRNGEQWGEHRTIDEFLCLCIATGIARFCLEDRSMWSVLPGGMPYIAFNLPVKEQAA